METEAPGTAQDLEAVVITPPPGEELETLAEVTIPTDDGQTSYRFSFGLVADELILMSIESPQGYPTPRIPSECELETFLRVAPADSVVPPELIDHCLTPAERIDRGVPEEGPVSVRALRLPGATLDFDYDAPIATCNTVGFQKRVDELEELAAFQPIIPTNCGSTCELGVAWDLTGCAFVDDEGFNLGPCSPLDHATLIFTYGNSGFVCMEHGPITCDYGPDPECAHTEFVMADWGPYGAWQRTSNGASRTTRVRYEVSSCGSAPTAGWWRMKKHSDDPFGPQHPWAAGAGTVKTMTLSAGWDGNDDWRGWDFQVHASGSNIHAISAWVELQGKNRFECPLAI